MRKEIFVVEVEQDEEAEKRVVSIDRLGKSIERLIRQLEKLEKIKLQVHLQLKDRAIASIEDTCEIGLSIDVDITMACSDLNVADEIRKELGDATAPLDIRRWIWCSDAEKFADGGVVREPHVGIVGEAGPEAIIPLSSEKRERGKALWYEAGNVLGVYDGTHDGYIPIDQREVNSCGSLGVKMYADGGIVGDNPTDISNKLLRLTGGIESRDNDKIWEEILKITAGMKSYISNSDISKSSDVLTRSANIFGFADELLPEFYAIASDVSFTLGLAADYLGISSTNPIDKMANIVETAASTITGITLAGTGLSQIPLVGGFIQYGAGKFARGIYDLLSGRTAKRLDADQLRDLQVKVNENLPLIRTVAENLGGNIEGNPQGEYAYDVINAEKVSLSLHGVQPGVFEQGMEIFEKSAASYRSSEFEISDREKSLKSLVNYIYSMEQLRPELVEISENFNRSTNDRSPLRAWIDKALKIQDPLGKVDKELRDIRDNVNYTAENKMMDSPNEWFKRVLSPHYSQTATDLLYWKVNKDNIEDLQMYAATMQYMVALSHMLEFGEPIEETLTKINISGEKEDFSMGDVAKINEEVYVISEFGNAFGLEDPGLKAIKDEEYGSHFKENFILLEESLKALGFGNTKGAIEDAVNAFNDIKDRSLKEDLYDILSDLLIISNTASGLVPKLNFEFEGKRENAKLILTTPDPEKIVERPEGWTSSLGLSRNLDIEPVNDMGNVGLKVADAEVKLWNDTSLGLEMKPSYSGMLASNSGIYVSDTIPSYTVYDTGMPSQTSERVAINVGGLGGINVTLNLDESVRSDTSGGVEYQISDVAEEVAQVIASRLSQVYSNIPRESIG